MIFDDLHVNHKGGQPMEVNVNYESTSSATYSTKSTISLNDAQENKLSGKEIVNAYLVQYQKQMMAQSSTTFGEQANTFSLADIGYTGTPIADLTQDEAKALVSEDGFFGIHKPVSVSLILWSMGQGMTLKNSKQAVREC